MKPSTALLWKECRELRWFLITGLGIFLILPLIGSIEGHWMHNQRLGLETTPWVVMFAGVLAVFIAVGSTCRDLSDRLMVFWRSRPISVGRWLTTKYLSGLTLVLLLCTLPLVAEIGVSHDYDRSTDTALMLLVWHPFVVMAIYSAAFMLGCLVRRVTQAAMLSLAAMLLIYFLPYVLPPLNWLSFGLVLEASEKAAWDGSNARLPWRVAYTPAHLHYLLGMLAISALSVIAAWLAVRRDLRVAADRKVMYWSIGLAGLLLLWATAYQVGSNLPVQQEMAMPGENQMARAISVNGNHAVLLTVENWPRPHSVTSGFAWNLWPLEVTSSGMKVGRVATLPRRNELGCIWMVNPTLADDGQHVYLLAWSDIRAGVGKIVHPELVTVRLDGGGSPVAHRLDLGDGPIVGGTWAIHLVGNRLYMAIGTQLAAADISDPSTPRLLWVRPLWTLEAVGPRMGWPTPGDRLFNIHAGLLDLDGMSPHERLEATVRLRTSDLHCLCGDILIGRYQDGLVAYRMTSLTDKEVRFEVAGQYRPTAIERVVQRWGETLTARNGVLYGMRQSSLGTVNLTVYDVGDPQHVRRTGHFAAPSRNYYWPAMSPLPDGRVLVGGTKLYLVGRPRGN
ncbi:MAG: hypothetical protein ACHRHE_02475 [Tepidisphaerales bacterium]